MGPDLLDRERRGWTERLGDGRVDMSLTVGLVGAEVIWQCAKISDTLSSWTTYIFRKAWTDIGHLQISW